MCGLGRLALKAAPLERTAEARLAQQRFWRAHTQSAGLRMPKVHENIAEGAISVVTRSWHQTTWRKEVPACTWVVPYIAVLIAAPGPPGPYAHRHAPVMTILQKSYDFSPLCPVFEDEPRNAHGSFFFLECSAISHNRPVAMCRASAAGVARARADLYCAWEQIWTCSPCHYGSFCSFAPQK